MRFLYRTICPTPQNAFHFRRSLLYFATALFPCRFKSFVHSFLMAECPRKWWMGCLLLYLRHQLSHASCRNNFAHFLYMFNSDRWIRVNTEFDIVTITTTLLFIFSTDKTRRNIVNDCERMCSHQEAMFNQERKLKFFYVTKWSVNIKQYPYVRLACMHSWLMCYKEESVRRIQGQITLVMAWMRKNRSRVFDVLWKMTHIVVK